MRIPYIIKLVFNKYFFYKIFAIGLLLIFFYGFREFFYLFLITFFFAYLFLSLGEAISNFLLSIIEYIKSNKLKTFLRSLFWIDAIILSLYIIFIALIIFAISGLLPKIIQELSSLPKSIPFLTDQVKIVLWKLEEVKNFNQDFQWTLQNLLTQSNWDIIVKFLWNIKSAGLILVEFVVSLILSYVFIIDRFKIQKYLEEIKGGNFAFLYHEYSVIFWKISRWFWMIFKAQSIISLVNTILTIIWLYIISFIHWWTSFPFIFTLAILVLIFWLIPVLGLFLSSIPILAIWFSYWWLFAVFEIIIMITIIHIIEAYYLNPRIVSSYMELPISLTFVILVVSEQIFWMIWFLIWIPIFYIVIDFMKDFDHYVSKVKLAYSKIDELTNDTKESIFSKIRLSRSGKRKE